MSVLDQQQTQYAYYLLSPAGDMYVGQIFKAGLSGQLATVKLWIEKVSTPSNLIVEIRTISGSHPTSTILVSEEISESSVPSLGELTVNFSIPATIITGTSYAIVCKEKTASGNSYKLYGGLGAFYTDGTLEYSSDAGANWNTLVAYDLYFKTYVQTETEVLSDINNDFRSLKLFAFDDINNDFRMVSDLVFYDISNDFRLSGATLADINNDFRLAADPTIRIDINNDFRFIEPPVVTEVESDIYNLFNLVSSDTEDINNDIRTQKLEVNNITNDFRMVASWQIPGDHGFQSLGKTYVKIYIDSVEQTDANIDTATINKVLNGTHIATFELGRAYDSAKPDMEAVVEIKYHNWVLYKGYITAISPTDSPESIRINCNDKFWKQNKTKKYFHVGRKPMDDKDLYYNTIKEGLSSECSFNVDIGDFIPQTISCFGNGESDCINSLIQETGNFAWFYTEAEAKKLWEGGKGDIINIEAQTIDSNVNLHQILRHQFTENVEGIVNKLRVQMGELTYKTFSHTSGTKEYTSTEYEYYEGYPQRTWLSENEILARDSEDGTGWDSHPSEDNYKYRDIFVKYKLEDLDPELGAWSDREPPIISIQLPFNNPWTTDEWKSAGYDKDILPQLGDGFSIDYEGGFLIFNEPIFLYEVDIVGDVISIRKPIITINLFKKLIHSFTGTSSENTEQTISNPLMFFTNKIGDYPETIYNTLNLTSLGKLSPYSTLNIETDQYGLTKTVKVFHIGYNDTEFAKDIANCQLSNTACKKIEGTIDITLDALMFYNIDLSKRIMINGVTDNPLNIEAISINLNSFTATLTLKSNVFYKRTVSIQSRGE